MVKIPKSVYRALQAKAKRMNISFEELIYRTLKIELKNLI